jgi:hypothetical protein
MNSIKRFTVFLILFHLHKVVQQAARKFSYFFP